MYINEDRVAECCQASCHGCTQGATQPVWLQTDKVTVYIGRNVGITFDSLGTSHTALPPLRGYNDRLTA